MDARKRRERARILFKMWLFLHKVLIVMLIGDCIKMGLTKALQDITHSSKHWLCYCFYEVIIYNL